MRLPDWARITDPDEIEPRSANDWFNVAVILAVAFGGPVLIWLAHFATRFSP